jgi:hypothetical protein
VKDHYDPEMWRHWAPKVEVRLPPARRKVMDFITEELAAGRPFPGPATIARHMGWKSSTSAADALFKLCSYDRVLDRRLGVYSVRGQDVAA